MSKCKLCGKRGLFLRVNKEGYCSSCSDFRHRFALEMQRDREIREQRWNYIRSIPERQIILAEKPYKRQTGFDSVAFSNITKKGQYHDVVVFDTETTGLAPSSDRIVEIAAIKYIDTEPIERFQTYINPGRPIPAEITNINHIDDTMVSNAPAIGQVLPAFDDFVGDSILVAHNLTFDLKFIYYSGSQVLNRKRKYIDTLEQAKRIIKKNEVTDYTLESLCIFYGIPNAREHSAIADADAVGALFFSLIKEIQD